MKMLLSEIAEAVSGHLVGNSDEAISSVAYDSRQVQPGALFVPLMGERDGHDFVINAQNSGAVASFWQKDHPNRPEKLPIIEVEDTLSAMQQLAVYYLNKVNPTVVAITGSNGKTTTKDMVAAVLAKRFNVYKTQNNFNNEIGVPQTILEMQPTTEILVLEMGMDRAGQLHHLSSLVHPDVAVITMIGEAHIEFFGSRDKIADAKMEITDYLREDGEFIFNGDEPLLQERAAKLSQEQTTFGFSQSNSVYPVKFHSYKHHSSFMINESSQKFSIPMIGKHNISNALAAINVGRHFGENDEEIAASLARFVPTANRMEWEKGDAGEDIMSDIYNSNPTAVRAVAASFAKVPVKEGGRRVVVLADMLELGEQSANLHADLAADLEPDQLHELYLFGDQMKFLYDKLAGKYDPQHLHYYAADEMNHLVDDLRNDIHPSDIVLLKGSHGMHLEKVLDRLK